ncbi:hypothetical protein D3C80_1251150 [compost metagenome]
MLVTVDRALQLLREVTEEHIGLALHRTDSAHLEHQPLQHQRTALEILRQQLPGQLGEVDQDGAGLEHGEVAVVAVDDGRDPAIGVDLEKLRGLLLFTLETQRMQAVGQLQLLEGDGHLVAIGGRGGVKVDHAILHCNRPHLPQLPLASQDERKNGLKQSATSCAPASSSRCR